MANDGSIASLTEEWIAVQIRTLDEFDDDAVEVYQGSTSVDGKEFIEQFLAGRDAYVAVMFEGDQPRELEEGDQAYDPTYGIYIAIQNARPGAARKGDDVTPGTNLIRDRLRNLLHDTIPALTANGFHTDRAIFRGVSLAFTRKDAFIMRAEIVVRETPAAA